MDIPKKATKEQVKAMTETEGNIRVSSVPGSGKTFVLTYRIAYLITELFVIFIPSHFRTSHSDYRISQTKVAVSLTSMSSGSMSISAMAPIGIAKHFSSSIYSVRETTLSSPQL